MANWWEQGGVLVEPEAATENWWDKGGVPLGPNDNADVVRAQLEQQRLAPIVAQQQAEEKRNRYFQSREGQLVNAYQNRVAADPGITMIQDPSEAVRHDLLPDELAGLQSRQRAERTHEQLSENVPGYSNPVVRTVLHGMAGTGASVASLAARAGEAVTGGGGADVINREANELEQAAAIEDQNSMLPPALLRGGRSAVNSLAKMLITRRMGMAGMTGGFVATTANQAITDGRDAGLSGAKLAAYAATQGAIEGGVMTVFNKLGLSGVEGQMLSKSAYREGLKRAALAMGKASIEELPEELITSYGQALTSEMAKVGPSTDLRNEDGSVVDANGNLSPMMSNLIDTTVATLLTVGIAGSPRLAQGAADTARGKVFDTMPETPPEVAGKEESSTSGFDMSPSTAQAILTSHPQGVQDLIENPSRKRFKDVLGVDVTSRANRDHIVYQFKKLLGATAVEPQAEQPPPPLVEPPQPVAPEPIVEPVPQPLPEVDPQQPPIAEVPHVLAPHQILRDRLHLATSEELDAAIDGERESEKTLVDRLFGENAKRYRQLYRAANSTSNPTAADKASAELETLVGTLTEAQQNELYGYGDPTAGIDDLRSVRDAISAIDSSSPQELGNSLRFAITKVSQDGSGPPEALAQLNHAKREIERLGYDPAEVGRIAAKAVAGRFSDPDDAAFMLERFLGKKAEPPVKPTPKLEPPKEATVEPEQSIISAMGDKYFWAKTRKELEAEKKQAVAASKARRADINKMKASKGFAKWRIKSMSDSAKQDIAHTEQYQQGLLDVHKERVREALAEGKPVPPEVLADYPDLAPTTPVVPQEELPPEGPGEAIPPKQGLRKKKPPVAVEEDPLRDHFKRKAELAKSAPDVKDIGELQAIGAAHTDASEKLIDAHMAKGMSLKDAMEQPDVKAHDDKWLGTQERYFSQLKPRLEANYKAVAESMPALLPHDSKFAKVKDDIASEELSSTSKLTGLKNWLFGQRLNSWFNISDSLYSITGGFEEMPNAFTDKPKTVKKIAEDLWTSWAEYRNLDPEGVFGPHSGLGEKDQKEILSWFTDLADRIYETTVADVFGSGFAKPESLPAAERKALPAPTRTPAEEIAWQAVENGKNIHATAKELGIGHAAKREMMPAIIDEMDRLRAVKESEKPPIHPDRARAQKKQREREAKFGLQKKAPEAGGDRESLRRWILEAAKGHIGEVSTPDFSHGLKRVSEDIRKGRYPDRLEEAIHRHLLPTTDPETGEVLDRSHPDWPRTYTLETFLEGIATEPAPTPDPIAELATRDPNKALKQYELMKGYDQAIRPGKKGFRKRDNQDIINRRDSDPRWQELTKAAKNQNRQSAADFTKERKAEERQQGLQDAAQGEVTPEAIKYAPLHELPADARMSIQKAAQDMLGETKSAKTKAVLEKIIKDAGADTGAAVEEQKERLKEILTGERGQSGKDAGVVEPYPQDPILKVLLAEPQDRQETLDSALAAIEAGRPNELAAAVYERLREVSPESIEPEEVADYLNTLRGPKAAEPEFDLAREPAVVPKKDEFQSTPTSQKALLSGLDALPGQQDLFDDVDKQPDYDTVEMGSPARMAVEHVARSTPTEDQSPVLAATSAAPYIPKPRLDTIESTSKRASVKDVMRKLSNAAIAFGGEVPFLVGHIAQRKALGIFKVLPEVIRLRTANDVETAAHELGHAIEKLLYGWKKGGPWKLPRITSAMQKELTDLGKALYGTRKPVGGYKREGFAEFIRLWLTKRPISAAAAPKFSKWFNDVFLPAAPKGAKALQEAADKWNVYDKQGAIARGQQNIVDPLAWNTRVAKWISEAKRVASFEGVWEVLQPLRLAEQKAEAAVSTKSKKLGLARKPYTIQSALRGTDSARVKEMVQNGMIDIAANPTGVKALDEAGKLVPYKQRTEFAVLLLAMRAKALLTDPLGPRNPGPMTLEDADYIISTLGTPQFLEAASIFHKWNDGVLDYAAAASPTFSVAVRAIRDRDPGNYVPLAREFDELERLYATQGGSSAAGGKLAGTLRGSGRRVIDPIQASISNAERIVKLAHTRMALDALIKLESIDGLGHLVEKIPVQRVPVLQRRLSDMVEDISKRLRDLGVDLHDQNGDPIDPDVFAKEIAVYFGLADAPPGGEPIIPYFNAVSGSITWHQVRPDIYHLFYPNMGTADWNVSARFLSFVGKRSAHVLRLGATGLSAPFSIITNSFMDTRSLGQNTASNANLAKAYWEVFKMMPVALADALTGGKVSNDAIRVFKRTGSSMAQRLNAESPFTRRLSRQIFESKFRRMTNVGDMLDYIGDVLQFSNTAARAAEIKLLADKGGIDLSQPLSLGDSINLLLAAKRVTTDFTAVGAWTQYVSPYVPFMRSALQGPRSTIRAAKNNPVGYTIKGMVTMGLAAGVWMMVKDEDWWKELDENAKLRYFHVPVQLGGRKEVLQVPLNQDADFLFGTGFIAMLDSLYQRDPEAAMEWAGAFAKNATPISKPPTFGVPILEEIYEQATNEDTYFESPIVSQRLEKRPPSQQYDEYTSEVSRLLGKTKVPWVAPEGISPKRIEHAIVGQTGSVGREALRVSSAAITGKMSGAERESEPSDIPVAGRLFQRGGPMTSHPKSIDQLYDLLEKANTKHADVESPETEDERQRRLVLTDASEAIKSLGDARSKTTGVDERRDLTEQQVQIARQAIQQYESTDGKVDRKPMKGFKKQAAKLKSGK